MLVSREMINAQRPYLCSTEEDDHVVIRNKTPSPADAVMAARRESLAKPKDESRRIIIMPVEAKAAASNTDRRCRRRKHAGYNRSPAPYLPRNAGF